MKLLSREAARRHRMRCSRARIAAVRSSTRRAEHAKRRDRFLRRNGDRTRSQDIRSLLKRSLYSPRPLKPGQDDVLISGAFGLEEHEMLDSFLDDAERCIDSDAAHLALDFGPCTRMWPSAVTLLCSLKEWVTLTRVSRLGQKVSSVPPRDHKVNSYLAHCGFYDFVNAFPKPTDIGHYTGADVVQISKETKRADIESREDNIIALLTHCSDLSSEEIELFNCVILTEVFNNITEHGIDHVRNGWWLLVQHHPTHGIISLCFADNGIGIRNSLITGPQRIAVEKRHPPTRQFDGEYIRMASEESVSGAIAAPIRSGRFRPQYPQGAKRGNGLKRICAACKSLRIRMTILSHYGYASWDRDGNISNIGSRDRRVFAGTMYHFVVGCRPIEKGSTNAPD